MKVATPKSSRVFAKEMIAAFVKFMEDLKEVVEVGKKARSMREDNDEAGLIPTSAQTRGHVIGTPLLGGGPVTLQEVLDDMEISLEETCNVIADVERTMSSRRC